MTIAFSSIPSNLRIPFFAMEFDGSNANASIAGADKGIIFANKTSAGAAVSGEINPIFSDSDAIRLAGRRSVGRAMAKAVLANASTVEWYLCVIDDNGAGVAPVWTLTVSGTATKAGTLPFYFGTTAEPVQVGVAVGDTASAIAAAINTALGANADIQVTASVTGAVVTATHANKGTMGNHLTPLCGGRRGDVIPADLGITVTIVQTVTGSGNPTLSGALANWSGEDFALCVHAWDDATSLTTLETEAANRWGPMVAMDVFFLAGLNLALASAQSVGNSRNSKHTGFVSAPGSKSPSAGYELAGYVGGIALASLTNLPSQPLQTLQPAGAYPPSKSLRFTDTERNTLLWNGVGATSANGDSAVKIDRLITTYKTNEAGSPSEAFLDVNTMFTLRRARKLFRSMLAERYPRHLIASDSPNLPANLPIMTESEGKTFAIDWYNTCANAGLFESAGLDAFITALSVERQGKNGMAWYLPPDIMNQFVVGAAKAAFVL